MPAQSSPVPGRTLSDEIIPARSGWSRELKQGEVLRLVDLESGEIRATHGFENPQIFGGLDVMGRISYDGQDGGRERALGSRTSMDRRARQSQPPARAKLKPPKAAPVPRLTDR